MGTELTVDSICYICGVVDPDIETTIIVLVERQDRESRKEERQKIAEKVRSLKLSDITTAETIHKAILEGGKC